jgi:predicted GNAT superfamily acetyltransferase
MATPDLQPGALAAQAPAPAACAAQAAVLAARAAQAAGIAIREAHEMADLAGIRRLFDVIWSADPRNPSATAELMRAYAHTGQYVVVADDLTRAGHPVVAASVAFLSAPAGVALHSHVTGVLPEGRGRALGFALKAHQRAWALQRGLLEVTWTFDPLIRRNAWFNLAKLGAGVREYLVDFYGAMVDGVNAGDASDRLYLGWPVADPAVADALERGPIVVDVAAERAGGAVPVLAVDGGQAPALDWPPSGRMRTALAQVPADIETLRRADPALGRAWRQALRTVLGGALHPVHGGGVHPVQPRAGGGWTVRGVGRDGWYVLDREDTG